ncbi:GEVED domain-containing protein [Patescibacteria group bacterium]
MQLPKNIHLGLIFLGIIVAFSLFQLALLAPSSWPTDTDWNLLTHNGNVLVDEEERGSCTDSTRNANVQQSNDIGSQADCQGPAPHYNPGNNGQPGSTDQNTYSAALYYEDANGDSSGCSNIADDYLYFRTRLVGDPLQSNPAKGFTNDYWWYLFDINMDNAPDFYIRLNGNGNKTAEHLDVIYETSGDADPTGEPVVANHVNPIDNGMARALLTPDNGTVGDYDESFLDFQLPLTDFDDNGGIQQLCEGSTLEVSKISTSANHNNPYHKDYILDLLLPSDPIVLGDSNYEVIKTVSGIVGSTVEYEVNINNLNNTLTGILYTDPLLGGGIFVTSAYGAGSGIQVTIDGNTFNMTNSADSPDTGGCTYSGCEADYNATTPGAVTFTNDWLYPFGSGTPLYDSITLRYQVNYPLTGTYSNQGYTVTNELTNNEYSDDPSYDDGSECSDPSGNNCNDGDTGNDDPTLATIHNDDFGDAPDPTYPTLLASGGAFHTILPGIYLGASIDSEPDGQPDPFALGDDAFDGNDDEDGVTFMSPLIPATPATIDVVASAPGFVEGWIDFNADGTWATPGDQIMFAVPVVPGLNTIPIIVPPTATPGPTYARFRYSTVPALPFMGPAPDGEVEDYLVDITANASIGDLIWDDENGDGNKDAPEPGLDGITVDLYLDDGDSVFEPGAHDGIPLMTQTTAGGGAYDFFPLSPGSYWIDVTDTGGVLTNFIQTGGNTLPELIVLGPAVDYNNADYGFYDTHSDDDGDGIIDIVECPGAPPFVACLDTDGDGFPNYLDIDADDDGIVDNVEAQSESAYVPPTGLDTDGDELDDAYDPDNGGFLITPVDRDVDLIPDYLDLDTDGDTVPDLIEGHDANFDGVPDTLPTGVDSDNDGLDDAFDTLPIGDPLNEIGSNSPLQDFDSDGVRDWRDYDDDDDLILTIDEDLNGNNDPTDDDADSDGHPEYLDYNPMGYFYNEISGQIIAGASISVTGPGLVTILEDGSNGYYKWDFDGTPGVYTMSYTLPGGWGDSIACLATTPAFDPTGQPNPVVLGDYEDSLNPGYLTSNTCTTYYLDFDLEADDPIIINNNIALMQLGGRRGGGGGDDDGPGGGEPEPAGAPEPELQEAPPEVCLMFNPDREIHYTDNVGWPKDYVDFLSRIYKIGEPRQYIISGDGSYHGDESTAVTIVRPLDFTNRFETVKIALTTFCIPIKTTTERHAMELDPNARLGFPDLPRDLPVDHPDRLWVSDQDLEFVLNVMYTAYDLGIIDGRMQPNGDNLAMWSAPMTRAEILKAFVNAADLKGVVLALEADEQVVENPEDYYYDADPNAWYAPYVPFVVRYKIVADVCMPKDVAVINGFDDYAPTEEMAIRTVAAVYSCDDLEDPARFTFADNPAVRAEVFALTARMLYIASSFDHVNQHSGFNMTNPGMIELVFNYLQFAERAEFLFSIKDTDAFKRALGNLDLDKWLQ